MAEKATYTRSAATLQNGFRRFRAVRERKRRARRAEVALRASLRTIGQAMSDLEDKVSALPEAAGGQVSRYGRGVTLRYDTRKGAPSIF